MATADYGPRERMVFSAAQLIRRDGVAATGLRDVVADAQAPRGSLQHYFPGGKQQLVDEAVAWGGRHASRQVDRLVARLKDPTPSKLFAAMVRGWIDDYRSRGFGAGCPIAAATIDWAEAAESTRSAAAVAFADWRRPIAAALVDMGVPRRRSTTLATLMISTLEGAILLARAEHSVAPLQVASRELGPLLDSAVRPAAFLADGDARRFES